MTDRDKVIKGLECCTTGDCEGCPYDGDGDLRGECIKRTQVDALEIINDLIRQADACHLPQSGRLNGETARMIFNGNAWVCSECGGISRDILETALSKYCPACGRRWIRGEKGRTDT